MPLSLFPDDPGVNILFSIKAQELHIYNSVKINIGKLVTTSRIQHGIAFSNLTQIKVPTDPGDSRGVATRTREVVRQAGSVGNCLPSPGERGRLVYLPRVISFLVCQTTEKQRELAGVRPGAHCCVLVPSWVRQPGSGIMRTMADIFILAGRRLEQQVERRRSRWSGR